MKKTLLFFFGIVFICAFSLTVAVNENLKFDAISQLTLSEVEASAQTEWTPPNIEPKNDYCRCKKLDDGTKGCRAGNFISLRPNCSPTDDDDFCNTHDADCSTAAVD